MQKSHILFGLASLAIVLYGVIQYDTNSSCYEIIPSQDQEMGTILLDKCQGQTRILITKDVDEDGDGKIDGYTYRWGAIKLIENGQPIWKEKK
ncbi:MAG: hypothetical protein AUJ12_08480 [Alphaproteobacteria bacterium CG1_02_46_17]|nr:MAG: hypothetical protein AUJ12_08480 [Alphaproteobacteria bacterium CG1_02_46_17]